MKKFLAMLAALAMMVCVLASCGKDKPTESGSQGTDSASSVTEPAEKPDTIGKPSEKKPSTATGENDIHVIKMDIAEDYIFVKLNKAVGVQYTVYPVDKNQKTTATDPSVYWVSSNEEVAQVDENGNILGVMPGASILSGRTNDRNMGDTATIIVYQNKGDDEKSAALAEKINALRAENNKEAFKIDNLCLNAAANQIVYEEANSESKDMDGVRADGSAYSSVFSDYKLWTRYKAVSSGYVGKNYTADKVFEMLKESADNKGNMLSDDYDQVGVGCYEGKDGSVYWIVLFMSQQ